MLTQELVKTVELQAKSHAPRTSVLPKTVLALYRFWAKHHKLIDNIEKMRSENHG